MILSFFAFLIAQMLKEIGHNLINLNFGGCHLQFDDECLKPVVKYCHNLECLSLDLCTRVRGEPLKDLLEDDKRAKKMKVFSFSACKDVSSTCELLFPFSLFIYLFLFLFLVGGGGGSLSLP